MGTTTALNDPSLLLAAMEDHLLVCILDETGHVVDVNRRFCERCGYEKEELLGLDSQRLCFEESQQAVWNQLWETATSGQSCRDEFCIQFGEGLPVWIDATLMPCSENAGHPTRFVLVATDTTDKKNSEEDDAIIRRALDENSLMSVADRSGKIRIASDGFCRISGYPREELLGQDHRILNSGHHPKEFWAEMWHTINSGKTWRGEVCNRAKNGSLYWVDSTITPCMGPDGRPEKYVSIRIDITARKRLEHEVEAARHARDMAINGSSDGLWDYNLLTEEVWYSDQFLKLLGYEPEERDEFPPRLASFNKRLHPDDRNPTIAAVELYLEQQVPYDVEYRLLKKDGKYCWFRARAKGEWDEQGNPIRLAGSITDIQAQKEAESSLRSTLADLADATAIANSMAAEAEAASVAKSEFLANMSHEIRTPMTAILGYSEILLGDEGLDNATPEQVECLQTIKRNGEYLLTIINDILDLSKIEAGQMQVEAIDTSTQETVEHVLSLMEVRAKAKNLKLQAKWQGDIPEVFACDPVRLRQCLINLVGNAIKFTEHGSVSICASIDSSNAENPLVKFEVVDTGIGLADWQMDRLFQAFSQADTSTTRKFGGTGLGLTISKRLAELMGGDITVASKEGEGSTFTLTVAAGSLDKLRLINLNKKESGTKASQERAAQAETSSPAEGSEKPLDGVKVLFAEDGPDNQRLVAFVLKKAGAEVTVVENGRLAVEQLTADATLDGDILDPAPFDVMLLDMQMPEMDGYTAAGFLREKGSKLPIIALTAHAMSGERDKCIAAGCDDYGTKPIDRKKLIEQILEWTKQRQPATTAVGG